MLQNCSEPSKRTLARWYDVGDLGNVRLVKRAAANAGPKDYTITRTFVNTLNFVFFRDLSRTSPTGSDPQTRLTGFGLTCHARDVRSP